MMKKFFCILLVSLLVILAGCQANNNSDDAISATPALNSNPTDTKHDQPDSPETEYVILVNASAESMVSIKNNSTQSANKIRFEDASERDFYYTNKTDIPGEVDKTKFTLELANINEEITYKESFANLFADSENDYLKQYAYYDEYRGNAYNHSLIVRYRQSNNELAFLSLGGTRSVDGPLTQEEAKAMADAFVTEQYGAEFLKEYPDYSFLGAADNVTKTICIAYRKYICGYPTVDRILVNYNMLGELVTVNAMNKGLFAEVEASITAEKLANAEDILLNAIDSSWSVYHKDLVLDENGACYLRAYAERDNPQLPGKETVEFYANIDTQN